MNVLRSLCLLLFASLPTFAYAQAPAEAPAIRTIVLVRHGHYVADETIAETSGPPLSPLGIAQARLAGSALAALPDFDHHYVSPMHRARDTAAAIAQDLPAPAFAVVDDLAECTPPTRRTEITVDEKPEDLAACRARLERVFARFFVPAAGAGDDADLLVCHGNVIRYLVTRALGVDDAAWLEMSVRHASMTVIRVEADGRFKVIAVGDSGHVPVGLRTGASGDPERGLVVPALTP
jgi:serine/threonine-protein phosphatase PGAM5